MHIHMRTSEFRPLMPFLHIHNNTHACTFMWADKTYIHSNAALFFHPESFENRMRCITLKGPEEEWKNIIRTRAHKHMHTHIHKNAWKERRNDEWCTRENDEWICLRPVMFMYAGDGGGYAHYFLRTLANERKRGIKNGKRRRCQRQKCSITEYKQLHLCWAVWLSATSVYLSIFLLKYEHIVTIKASAKGLFNCTCTKSVLHSKHPCLTFNEREREERHCCSITAHKLYISGIIYKMATIYVEIFVSLISQSS